MKKILIDESVLEQALEALQSCSGVPHWTALQPTITALCARLAQQEQDTAVHMTHCNQGEWEGVCKYGEEDCPALAQQGCTYTVKEMDGFGTLWATECGEELYVAAPEAIGFSLAPMPNEDGKFCQFCGNKIVLEDQK